MKDAYLWQAFQELMEAFCLDEPNTVQRARLAQLLRDDREMQKAYLQYLHLHVCLRHALSATPMIAPLPQQNTPKHSRPVLQRVIAIAAALVMLLGLWLAVTHRPSAEARHEMAAVLTDSYGCSWGGGSSPHSGESLTPRRLILKTGLAEFTFGNGAIAVIEAPAEIELINSARAFLHSGRVVVRVPTQKARGFILDTVATEIKDLGTEFGASIGNQGDAQVQVFKGEVVLANKGSANTGESRHLVTGQSVELDATPGSIMRTAPFAVGRFVRTMPSLSSSERKQPAGPLYNKSHLSVLTVPHARSGLVIDGDLSDWDMSDSFESKCDPPFDTAYQVRGAMMYDTNCLYVGAHVSDPYPMRSVMDVVQNPDYTWQGGSVVVRLVADQKAGWPVDIQPLAENQRTRRSAEEDALNTRIAHIILWYHRPSKTPCLEIDYGMDRQDRNREFHGWRGAFREDPDGRGYTLEYAIPWALLRTGTNPLHAGDEVAANWTVHWSGVDGRLCNGFLTEITNPGEPQYVYNKTKTWGKAVFK